MLQQTIFLIIVSIAILIAPQNIKAQSDNAQESGAKNASERAEIIEKPGTLTDSEKVIFTFFKLIDQTPDFEKWVKLSSKYQNAHKLDKDNLLNSQTENLQTSFTAFKKSDDIFTLTEDIRVMTFIDRGGRRYLRFHFTDQDKNTKSYFSFPYARQKLALVIEKLQDYKTVTVSPEETTKLKKYFFDSTSYQAKLQLTLKPISADATKPFFIDDEYFWLMMAQIESIEIVFYDKYNLENVVIWSHKTAEENDTSDTTDNVSEE